MPPDVEQLRREVAEWDPLTPFDAKHALQVGRQGTEEGGQGLLWATVPSTASMACQLCPIYGGQSCAEVTPPFLVPILAGGAQQEASIVGNMQQAGLLQVAAQGAAWLCRVTAWGHGAC